MPNDSALKAPMVNRSSEHPPFRGNRSFLALFFAMTGHHLSPLFRVRWGSGLSTKATPTWGLFGQTDTKEERAGYPALRFA